LISEDCTGVNVLPRLAEKLGWDAFMLRQHQKMVRIGRPRAKHDAWKRTDEGQRVIKERRKAGQILRKRTVLLKQMLGRNPYVWESERFDAKLEKMAQTHHYELTKAGLI
jgi:hypothetical protein